MARAAATVEDLKAGRLPPVCAKTGEAANDFAKIEFASTAGWKLILLLFGIIPFLIAQAFSTVRVVGLVPMSDVALRRARVFNWASLGFLLSGLVLVVGFATTDSTVILVGLAMLVAAILFMLLGASFVWPTGEVKGDWVQLSFVDRRFARALDDWYRNT